MKKIFALLLVAVMCLSLSACGGKSSAEKVILGAWKSEGGYDILVFTDDGKITRGKEEMDWWYDKGAERYSLSYYGMTFTFVIEEDAKGRFFAIDGVHYYYVEDYDAVAMEAEKIASLTAGKTELLVGNTYTTESGVEFTFEKAEITGEDDGYFNLYITSEENLYFSAVKYNSFNGWSGFGIGQQSEGNEGNTRRYAGCSFKSLSSLEEDRDQYGFLCFTIDETAYYVSINTFFE